MTLEEYAKQYIDTHIETANKLGPNTVMGQACLARANTVMDLVEAFREYKKKYG